MSAPNQGRQSPDPERQSGAQAGAQGSGNHDNKGTTDNQAFLDKLPSNPTQILEKEAEKKTSKHT
jgi:hypothetical protein